MPHAPIAAQTLATSARDGSTRCGAARRFVPRRLNQAPASVALLFRPFHRASLTLLERRRMIRGRTAAHDSAKPTSGSRARRIVRPSSSRRSGGPPKYRLLEWLSAPSSILGCRANRLVSGVGVCSAGAGVAQAPGRIRCPAENYRGSRRRVSAGRRQSRPQSITPTTQRR